MFLRNPGSAEESPPQLSRLLRMGRELIAPRIDRTTRISSGVASPVTTNHAAKGSVFVNLINGGNFPNLPSKCGFRGGDESAEPPVPSDLLRFYLFIRVSFVWVFLLWVWGLGVWSLGLGIVGL